jgi:hypothetical protein
MKRAVIIFLTLFFISLCTTVAANDDFISSTEKFKDTFQYHSGDNPSDVWSYTASSQSIVNGVGATYNKVFYHYTGNNHCPPDIHNAYLTNNYPFNSNYIGFVLRFMDTWIGTNNGIKQDLEFYDSENNLIGSVRMFTKDWNTGGYTSYWPRFSSATLYEFLATGDGIYLFINRVSQGRVITTTETDIAYIKLVTLHDDHGSSCSKLYLDLDDFFVGDGVIGIGTEISPSHTITEVTNHEIDVSWAVKSFPPDEYVVNSYTLKVKSATNGLWYNITEIKKSGNSSLEPSGFVNYDWYDLFQANHFGLYWFTLWKNAEEEPISTDWIFFSDITDTSWIDIDKDLYAIGDEMEVTYSIDGADFGANDYYIYFYDSSGDLVASQALTEATGSVTITSTIEWEEGTAWAVLVKDTQPNIDMDPPTDIVGLACDVTFLSNVVKIHGKCYDATNPLNLVTGTPLANVSVNFTHNENYYTNVSQTDGSYIFLDIFGDEEEFYKDVPIYVHASKTGYNFGDYEMEVIRAGTYEIDLYLVPDERSCDLDNSSIAGLVLDDVFHQAIPGATVHISNGSWVNTTTTNTWGYYIFEDSILGHTLGNQSFSMYVDKPTYDTTDVDNVWAYNMSYLLDNCDVLDYLGEVLDECDVIDANGTWQTETGNALSVNTTDYVESNGSVVCVGNKTIAFQKQFSSALETNVTGNGYFYFYSKVEDTSHITSNVTVIISSSGDNSTDMIEWSVNKSLFTSDWNLTLLPISSGTETGTCNLSAINFTEIKCTKDANVTFKIDYLRFIEWVGWYSDLGLSLDTGDKQEGTGSINAEGESWQTGRPFWVIEASDWYVARNFVSPLAYGGLILSNPLMRLEYWYKPDGSLSRSILISSDTDGIGNYSYWNGIDGTGATWNLMRIWGEDGYENGTLDMSSIDWLIFFGYRVGLWNLSDNYDYIRLRQVGRTYHNFEMSAFYNLTVHCKDYETHNTIVSFTAVFDETNVESTTDGTVVFHNITYGVYRLEAASAGYYTGVEYVFMGQDTTETVYLIQMTNTTGGVGTYYPPPHLVEFRVQNIWGHPYSNVIVTITASETTMSTWDWLTTVFGFAGDPASEIENSTMNGTTDDYGDISFLMVETIKYRVTAVNTTQGINVTKWIYPKDDHYVIIVGGVLEWWGEGTEEMMNLTIDISTTILDDTHANITVVYSDSSGNTEELWIYLNTTANYTERSCLDSYNVSGTSVVTHNFTVSPYSGRSYFVNVVAQHPSFGTKVWSFAVKFKGLLIDLGLPYSVYPFLAFALLIFMGGLFGATSAAQGSLITTFGGWLLYGIGWFTTIADTTMIACLSLATLVSILLIKAEKSRKTGVQ